MLKKMRWRFIFSAMAAFSTVVLTLLCIINIWNYRIVTGQQDDTLLRIEEAGDRTDSPRNHPPFGKMEDFSPEVPYMLRFFSVHFDASGAFSGTDQAFIASINQEEATQYAQDVLSGGKMQGYYKGYRYLVQNDDTGTTVVFLNSERELQSIRNLLLITAAIAAGCLVIVFILVVLFSQRAIFPYLRNMEAQKQFVTNASHELKTPLTAISTSADVLAMEYENDEWVQSIQAQAAKLSKLITNLITLSRLDEENPFPVRASFSLSEALWDTAEPFSHLAQAKGKKMQLDIANDLTCTGDRTAIQQMISILLDNALKYAPDGGHIRLSAKRTGKKAEIAVSNAIDAPPDVSRLFDRFYRADESHGGAVSGTGIGLSIAKATAEAHGGSIRADAKNGTITFVVKLPL